MKQILAALLTGMILTGCMADKPQRSSQPPQDPGPLIARYYDALQDNKEVLIAALNADKGAASAVAISSVPAAPEGTKPVFYNLKSLTIVSGCQGAAEQCLSPSMPAAGSKQRAEPAADGNRSPMDGQADTHDRTDVGNVGTVIDERTDAAPPQPALRLIQPGK